MSPSITSLVNIYFFFIYYRRHASVILVDILKYLAATSPELSLQ